MAQVQVGLHIENFSGAVGLHIKSFSGAGAGGVALIILSTICIFQFVLLDIFTDLLIIIYYIIF